jgi:ParB family chromosome partitioning protein
MNESDEIDEMWENSLRDFRVADIIVGDRHRRDLGDIDALARSIGALGLLQPVVLRPDRRLVSGFRRLAAVKKLGWRTVEVTMVHGLDDEVSLLRAERDENTCRKDFTPSEAVAIGTALEEREKAKAKERQQEGRKAGGKAAGRGRPKK